MLRASFCVRSHIISQKDFISNTRLMLCSEFGVKHNNNELHLYSAFLGTQSPLHRRISSTTTNVQHSPGWCDGSHIAPERPPHTGLLVERRREGANQNMIRRPWWSEVKGRILARMPRFHPYSFSKDIMGFLMTTESQDLGLTFHLCYYNFLLDKRFINASHVWKDV